MYCARACLGMNDKQYRYVITLDKEGSFSKAAEALGITQPSLSQYIKNIEKEIGLPLFNRMNCDVKLTDAGRVFVDAGKRILTIEHQMENAFIDLATYKTGSLIIGAAPYRAASMMPEIARDFRLYRPGMHLIVREGTTVEILEGLEHGDCDLALTILPVNKHLFQYEPVLEEELVLAVPNSLPPFQAAAMSDRKYLAIDAKALNGQSMVMLTDVQYMQKQLYNLLLDYKLEVTTAAIVKSLEAQIEMVKEGIGLALMPSGIERFCKGSRVRFYSFVQPLPKREVIVAWRRDHKLSKAEEELVAVIRGIRW